MSLRKLTIGLITSLGIVGVVFVLGRMIISSFEHDLMEHKSARQTIGTIVDKKHVQFGPGQDSYHDDEGRTIPVSGRRKTSGDFRVLYKIDNFDQLSDSIRSRVVATERDRGERFGPRFTIVDQHTYDQARIGQRVDVTYRWADTSKIEVISVQLHLSLPKIRY